MSSFSVNWRQIWILVGIAALALIVIEFNARLKELNQLSDNAQSQRATATQAMQTQFALQTQVAYATSDAAVDEAARNSHMIQEGDIPGVPLGSGDGTVISTPTPLPAPTPMPNWQVWWNLFFEER